MEVNHKRIMRRLEQLADFTSTPGKGSTRTTYSKEFRQALNFICVECRSIGLVPIVDGMGNLRCRLPGKKNGAASVMVGSHVDTVINGGN